MNTNNKMNTNKKMNKDSDKNILQDFYSEIIYWIKNNQPNKIKLSKKKRELSKKYSIKDIPTDINILLNASSVDSVIIRPFLQTKPTRTISGVAVIAVMSKPVNCPHGSCIYCPGGTNSSFGNVPKSYTGKEPSTLRAIRNDYDPYKIIFNRLEQYVVLGQDPSKVEQIIMGGSFTGFPKSYQEELAYYSFKAFNDFSREFYSNTHDGSLDINHFREFFELPGDINDTGRAGRIKERINFLREKNIKTLEDEQRENESAAIRCIGLTIETKPDLINIEVAYNLLRLGVTRVELGIQSVYDEVLKFINRGYDSIVAKESIALLKDLGFKINIHMMLGLPEIDGERICFERDVESLKRIFSDEGYRPDMLKIYPCMVMKGTLLEDLYRKKIYTPLLTSQAADIIVESKKYIPEYCRVMRIQRDIPTHMTIDGVDRTNLRQYVDRLASEKGVRCRCMRCREIKGNRPEEKTNIVVREYTASGGKEFFISVEDEENDVLYGYCRLRFPQKLIHPSITSKSTLIRELHVYGRALAINMHDSEAIQHKGLGKKLLMKAEEISSMHNKEKIVVISGVGVRKYYAALDYRKEGPYMVKNIQSYTIKQ
jgi:elongator complex protein 3